MGRTRPSVFAVIPLRGTEYVELLRTALVFEELAMQMIQRQDRRF
jgi:hypothetical protein